MFHNRWRQKSIMYNNMSTTTISTTSRCQIWWYLESSTWWNTILVLFSEVRTSIGSLEPGTSIGTGWLEILPLLHSFNEVGRRILNLVNLSQSCKLSSANLSYFYRLFTNTFCLFNFETASHTNWAFQQPQATSITKQFYCLMTLCRPL